MNKLCKILGLACATVIAGAAAATGAGGANAVIVDDWDMVKHVNCVAASAADNVKLSRTNKYGNDETEMVRIFGLTSDPNWKCATWQFNVPEGFGGLSNSMETFGPGKVYCAIYVNGSLVSKSTDIGGEYGEYIYCI